MREIEIPLNGLFVKLRNPVGGKIGLQLGELFIVPLIEAISQDHTPLVAVGILYVRCPDRIFIGSHVGQEFLRRTRRLKGRFSCPQVLPDLRSIPPKRAKRLLA